MAIEGVYAYDDNTLSVSATFTKDDPVVLYDTRAFLLVLEDDCYYGGSYYDHITRAAYEANIVLNDVGDFVIVSHDFVRNPAWNMDNIDCIAFLQRMTPTGNKEIYQSAHVPLVIDFSFAFVPALGSVPDGNGTVELEGVCTNVTADPDNLTFALNNTFGWEAEFMIEGDAGFHTDPVTYPMAPGQERQVWLRVTTDGEVRVGTGYVEVTSDVSERTQATPGRVFNGSPAILMVDDDRNRPDEGLILDALDDAGLLADHWDAHNSHAGDGPELADMNGYDIILWHTGWSTMDLLTEEDQAACMAFMDTGGGFILTSQSFLESVDPSEFTQDYLGIDSWESNVGADQAIGIGGDPITNGMDFVVSYPQFWWDRADDVAPNAIGTVIFHSENGDRPALRADNGAARSVLFAFCMNGMDPLLPDPNNPKTLLARAVEYVAPASGQAVPEDGLAALPSAIRGIEPNPLGGGLAATTLRLRISERAAGRSARLDVLDLNGRLVRNLLNETLPTGVWTATWDGRDAGGNHVDAGVYYVRFLTAEGTHSAKMVVLR